MFEKIKRKYYQLVDILFGRLTIKGTYYLQYLLDNYINKISITHIEAYEDIIDTIQNKLNNFTMGQLTPHETAAYTHFATMIATLKPERFQYYFNQIIKSADRSLITNIINN